MTHTILAVVVPAGHIIAELAVTAPTVAEAKATLYSRNEPLWNGYYPNGRNVRLFTGNQLLAWRERQRKTRKSL